MKFQPVSTYDKLLQFLHHGTKMPSLISALPLRALRTAFPRPACLAAPKSISIIPRFAPILRTPSALNAVAKPSIRTFTTSPFHLATYNQVRRGCRKAQRARRARSPALKNKTQLKGVCLKTGITKPKKPNSGERKTARVRLSSGKVVTALIPGEGLFASPEVIGLELGWS